MSDYDLFLRLVCRVLFFIGGLTAFSIGFYVFYKSMASRKWPKAIGKVTYKGIDEDMDDGVNYKPIVTVVYKVRRKQYRTERVVFGDYWGSEARAKRFVEKYNVGARVPVFYNPKRPKEAVLEPGLIFGVFHFMMIFGFLFTGVWVLVTFVKTYS